MEVHGSWRLTCIVELHRIQKKSTVNDNKLKLIRKAIGIYYMKYKLNHGFRIELPIIFHQHSQCVYTK